MILSRTLLLLAFVSISALPLAAQNHLSIEDSAPVLAPLEPPAEVPGGPIQSVSTQAAVPTPPEDPTAEFRRTVQEFRERKHQYVHCKLKNGKILTGQIKAAGYEAFDIQTEAFAGFHTVNYTELAETPRAVPAVGTRFRQGAEWTGMIVFVVVFFIPLALTGGIPSC